MRYLFGFICICTLAIMPLVGCSDTQSACERDADCDDRDDCTVDTCEPSSGECGHAPAVDGTSCDFGEAPGICVSGVCQEDLCDGVDCDDENDCTHDSCNPADGTCSNTPILDGTVCDFGGLPGVCTTGVCEDAMLCEQIECDDGNECTEDTCDPLDGMCDNTPVEDGTPCANGGSSCDAGSCGACGTAENGAVYDCLEFTDGKGEQHTGTDAAAAIGNECLRGSDSSIPPIEGCGRTLLDVLACFPNCPDETVQALAGCVADCTQDTTADLCPPGLSDDCVHCTGQSEACSTVLCIVACVADPTAQMCIDCRCDNNCIPLFVTCSGIPSDQCN